MAPNVGQSILNALDIDGHRKFQHSKFERTHESSFTQQSAEVDAFLAIWLADGRAAWISSESFSNRRGNVILDTRNL